MEEVKLDLNKICIDNEDPMLFAEVRCSHGFLLPLKTSWSDNNPGRRFWSCPYYGAIKCNFFQWRDDLIDERSKFIIPKLVKKLKEMNEQLASKARMRKRMDEMVFFSDSEMMENSTVMEIEDESASSVKKDKEAQFERMKNALEKPIEVKKKESKCCSFNRIFCMFLLMCVSIWINWLLQVENVKTCHDQLP